MEDAISKPYDTPTRRSGHGLLGFFLGLRH